MTEKKQYPEIIHAYVAGRINERTNPPRLGMGWIIASSKQAHIQSREITEPPQGVSLVRDIQTMTALQAIENAFNAITTPKNHEPPTSQHRIHLHTTSNGAYVTISKKGNGRYLGDNSIDTITDKIISSIRTLREKSGVITRINFLDRSQQDLSRLTRIYLNVANQEATEAVQMHSASLSQEDGFFLSLSSPTTREPL